MPWTGKYTDLIIGGAIGSVLTIVTNVVTGLGARAWRWWDDRRATQAKLHHFARQIEHTESARQLSRILVALKAFLLQFDVLLKRASVKAFFDAWLTDVLLDATGEHPKLVVSQNAEAKKKLKADAAKLLR